MQTPVLVKAGNATYTGSRAGDFSGITVDPSTGTSFWAANEYKGSSALWTTWVANFSLSSAPPSSGPPVIASLSDSPDPLVLPGTLTLTANGVSDPDGSSTVASVSFYRDSNGNGTLETGIDTLLGTDVNGADGWRIAVNLSNSLASGTYRYFAQAKDASNLLSNVVSTTNTANKKNGPRVSQTASNTSNQPAFMIEPGVFNTVEVPLAPGATDVLFGRERSNHDSEEVF
jgi:hypothetical protein